MTQVIIADTILLGWITRCIHVENEELAQKEWGNVLKWADKEEVKVTKRLKAEGKYRGGLDGNAEDYAYIGKGIRKRIKEIQEKYNPKSMNQK